MPIFPTNGAKMFIGGAVDDRDTDFVEADFAAESWLEINGMTNMGEFGDTSEVITANIINLNRTKKAKGTRNAGNMAAVAAFNASDPGQLALRAAEKTSLNYAFRVVFNDAPPGGHPSERMFVALVMGARTTFNEANNVVNLTGGLEINSNIVEIDRGVP